MDIIIVQGDETCIADINETVKRMHNNYMGDFVPDALEALNDVGVYDKMGVILSVVDSAREVH